MNASLNGSKKNSRKISEESRNKMLLDKQNINNPNLNNTDCPDLVNFIMNKRLKLKSFYDQKGSKEFLKSKQQALEKIELDDETNEICIRSKSRNKNLTLSNKLKGILKSPHSSKFTNESDTKSVSFDSNVYYISTPKSLFSSKKSNFSNKSNNSKLELKNWEKANNTFKCSFLRKVKQDFTAVIRKVFEENDD